MLYPALSDFAVSISLSPYLFQRNLAQTFIWNHIEGFKMLIIFTVNSYAIIVYFLHFLFAWPLCYHSKYTYINNAFKLNAM
jgi:hypothetical protein